MMRGKVWRVTLIWVLMVFLVGCAPFTEEVVYDEVVKEDAPVYPEQIIDLGDEFEYYPGGNVEGHFVCRVTDVWILEDEASCPPEEDFGSSRIGTMVDGETVFFEYDEWFTEGGAYDHGCRIVMVDVTMTNVDAASELYKPDFTGGLYNDPYMFLAYNVVKMVDLTRLNILGEGHRSYMDYSMLYFSYMGKCYTEDDPLSGGDDRDAIRIAPGETVTFTVGFEVNPYYEEGTIDLPTLWLSVGASTDVELGVFMDTGLGDDLG